MPPGETTLFLQGIVLRPIPRVCKGSNVDVWFTVQQRDLIYPDREKKYNSKNNVIPYRSKRLNIIHFDTSKKLLQMSEDVLVTVYKGTMTGSSRLFAFWINTRFAELTYPNAQKDDPLLFEIAGNNPILTVKKAQMDKAVKDCSKHRLYDQAFRAELIFSRTSVAGEVKRAELERALRVKV